MRSLGCCCELSLPADLQWNCMCGRELQFGKSVVFNMEPVCVQQQFFLEWLQLCELPWGPSVFWWLLCMPWWFFHGGICMLRSQRNVLFLCDQLTMEWNKLPLQPWLHICGDLLRLLRSGSWQFLQYLLQHPILTLQRRLLRLPNWVLHAPRTVQTVPFQQQ